MRPAERHSGAAPLITRAFLEAIPIAAAASVVHVVTGGAGPLPLIAGVLGLTGAALVLASVLREARATGESAGIAAAAIIGAIVWGISLPVAEADGLATLTRVIAFGILGEVYLARAITLATGTPRWSDSARAAAIAAVSLALIVVVPRADSAALAVLAFALIAATAVALSLGRSGEELAFAGEEAAGEPGRAPPAVVAFVVGCLALVAAFLAPVFNVAAAAAGEVVGPLVTRVAYVILLPFGYLAAWLTELLAPLLRRVFELPAPPPPPVTDAREEEMLRALEQTRPFVYGAVEILIAIGALIAAAILVQRLTRERRTELPAGVTAERDHVGGIGVGEMFAALLPRRARGRHAPRGDGTNAGAIRLLYWRFVAAVEDAGYGWRYPGETPAEHHVRAAAAEQRWSATAPLVTAFERVRYGEEDVDAATVDEARDAFRRARGAAS